MEEYIGKRVVPRHDGSWDKSRAYEALVIVLDPSTGDSYTSKMAVPAGTALSNTDYWARSGVFNAQLQETYDDIVADNDATEKAIKADNDATEKAIKADNDATETAVKEDNAETKSYVDSQVKSMTAATDAAVNLTTTNRSELEERMASIEARQDANVSASTDTDADYAAEVVDARVDSDGASYASLGAAVRRYDPIICNVPKMVIFPAGTTFKGENGNTSTGTMEEIQENGRTIALDVTLNYVENEASSQCVRCAGCISKEIYEEKMAGKTAVLQVYSDADMEIHVSCGFSSVSIKGNALISNTVVHKGLNLFPMDLSSEEFLSLNNISKDLYFHLLWGNYLGISQPPSGQYHFVMSVYCDEDNGMEKAKAAYVVNAARADEADHAAESDRSAYADEANEAGYASKSDYSLCLGAEYLMKGLYTKTIQPALEGFDDETGYVHLTLTKDTPQDTDKGFSVKIGTRESLTGRKIILYRKEALPLSYVAINAGASWGGHTYSNVQKLFSQLYGDFWVADFDALMDSLIQSRDAVDEDFQGDIYLMVYGNADWDMGVFETEGNSELHSYYSVYGGYGDSLLYSEQFMQMLEEKKSVDSVHADYADESVHADSADEAVHASDADRAASLGLDYIMQGLYTKTIQPALKGFDDETGFLHITLNKDTPQATDKGFSVRIGTRESLTGRKIILYRNEGLPLKNISINAGHSWGNQTYSDVQKYFTCFQGDYWIADFDTLIDYVIAHCSKVEEDFQGDIYLMMYGNADWDMSIFGTDDTGSTEDSTEDTTETVTELHSYYCVYAGNEDAMIYTPSYQEVLSDVTEMKETLDRISEEGLEEKCTELIEKCETLSALVETMEASNVLWGKKYVACGDSFTEGDFSGWTDENGLSGKNSPVIYDSDLKEYKTYPWWIAKRNNMTLVNEALCGSIMALSKDYLEDPDSYSEGYRSPFALNRYKAIPADADYITIWFGINDSSHTNLGTINDTDNTTFYGAWNVVLEYLITNMPTAKIGIIITNGAAATFREAEREIAKKWGIPYLDMMGDDQVPVIFGRETSLGLCSTANTLRKNAFYVTSSNGHPNLDAHKYQSTFIEAFLRRL